VKPRIYISRDAGALALGADEVECAIIAAEKKRGLDIEIVRTGSRGLFWLEPMIEVSTPQGRIAYGPVQAGDVESLFDAGLLDGKPHKLCLGKPEEIPFLKRQTRLTFARCGIVDRLSIDD
jgi:formate dehydrogenase iron-sulfur subunit